MARQLAEGGVARLLAVLGVGVFLGLLPFAWIDTAVAASLIVVGLGLALAWPRGNRVLGFGVAALGLMLLLAGLLDRAPAILNALTVFVAAILLAAAWFKHQGKW